MSRNAKKTFYEFFAGGGMARLGLGDEWQCLFANDFDPLKAATYRANFEHDHFQEGDIWKVLPEQLPGTPDLAWASSPCQDFSLAGQRAGLVGGRSSAFFGFWKLMGALGDEGRAPATIVIENVVGLLSSHKGDDFAALCAAFVEAGYRVGALEIDAARFVAQSRKRVFIIATKTPVPERLSQLSPATPFHSKQICTAYDRLPKVVRDQWVWWHLPFPDAFNGDLASLIESDSEVTWFSEERTQALVSLLSIRHRKVLADALARRTRTVGTIFRRMRVENGKKVQRAEFRTDNYAGCLRTPSGGSSKQFIVVVEDRKVRIRSMTGRESARLMGLDDDYKLPPRMNAALKITGDGVVVHVVRWLSENLLEPLVERQAELNNGQVEKEGLRSGT